MKNLYFTFLIALSALIVAGCEKSIVSSNDSTTAPSFAIQPPPPTTGDNGPASILAGVVPCGAPKVVDLWAGKTIDAGSVTIYNDATNLYVTVYSTYGYQDVTEQLKMWVGADFLTLPRNGQGVPVPGQFPYKITTDGGTTYTFTIPLNDLSLVNLCPANLYVVVHADVIASGDGGSTTSGETAFGGDTGGDTGNRWWYYTTYTTVCCNGGPGFDREETAYAKGGYVFTTNKKSNPEKLPSLNLTQNRWGWAINLTSDGTTTYDIWAGAGLNYTSNGVKVGTLTIVKTGSSVSVTYNFTGGSMMKEVHVYAGDFKPTTIAPGQYGYTQYFDPMVSSHTMTTTVEDTNSDGIWIVAHAVAAIAQSAPVVQ